MQAKHSGMDEKVQIEITGVFKKYGFKPKTENSRMYILRQNLAPAGKKGHESLSLSSLMAGKYPCQLCSQNNSVYLIIYLQSFLHITAIDFKSTVINPICIAGDFNLLILNKGTGSQLCKSSWQLLKYGVIDSLTSTVPSCF